jgi:hypothetical protein
VSAALDQPLQTADRVAALIRSGWASLTRHAARQASP